VDEESDGEEDEAFEEPRRVENPRRKPSTLILPPSIQNPQLRNYKTTLICRLLTTSVRNTYAFSVS
jgi:hypothetical protein